MAVTFEEHRWYVIVKEDNKIVGVIGNADGSGITIFESVQEFEDSI